MEFETIIKRLKSFGYEYKEDVDAFPLDFTIVSVTNHVLCETNCTAIPDKLMNIAIDMVCAEFLKVKKGFGQLTDYEFEQIADSIKLGDATVQLSEGATPEQKFDAVIEHILSGHESDFIACRKMVW